MTLNKVVEYEEDMIEESFEIPEVGSFLEEMTRVIMNSVEVNLRSFIEDEWLNITSNIIASMDEYNLDPSVEDQLIVAANNYSDLIIDKLMVFLEEVKLANQGWEALDELKEEFIRILKE